MASDHHFSLKKLHKNWRSTQKWIDKFLAVYWDLEVEEMLNTTCHDLGKDRGAAQGCKHIRSNAVIKAYFSMLAEPWKEKIGHKEWS
jgi:hypothetical protein